MNGCSVDPDGHVRKVHEPGYRAQVAAASTIALRGNDAVVVIRPRHGADDLVTVSSQEFAHRVGIFVHWVYDKVGRSCFGELLQVLEMLLALKVA